MNTHTQICIRSCLTSYQHNAWTILALNCGARKTDTNRQERPRKLHEHPLICSLVSFLIVSYAFS